MIYFANPSTEGIRDAMMAGRLGCIITPEQGNITFPDEWDVIADNGCFSGRWSHHAWLEWLIGLPRSIRFAVAPDVFDPEGGECHEATVERWSRYGPMIERHGFTPAFVCQVGATANTIPDAPVLFLGGTTEWKLGSTARSITAAAKRAGKWVHMGRVNSQQRILTAINMGCDSADGTFLTFGPDVNLPKLLRYIGSAEVSASEQPPLDLWGIR